ncbi:DUF4230 domain-containing protein [Amycolatopsis keratiniphila]|uniref:DUF4230 domain-containing protein n=1 Tax=Amycolatopsis keratiniphila TaxID=129921 RepID=UPI00087BC101|nr:DUF4230 domain-containing protein [Amycolatopsis keratiniphila]OLZ52883.1 hypothetical protein BS330_23700 [Amycolatopsis keratiniphila subsp. nogabecina]SDU07342.1 Protein of unknown function [Amycolatopsis keratiniphila]
MGVKKRWVRLGAFALAALLILAAALQITGLLPKLDPFGTSTVDHSQPAVLQAVRDLSQYHAAVGDYQVVVDIEKDVAWVPASIAGERTLFVAAGSVDAYVDFGPLVDNALTVSEDRRTVEVRLPEPKLAKPNLDNARSYVFGQERGLIDRLGALVSVQDQRPFYLAAEKRIGEAAQHSGLLERAKANTRAMLTQMLRALGFQVVFPAEPAT